MRHFKLLRLDSRTDSSSAERPIFVRSMSSADEEPTPRELEVEELLCRGYSQENIAAIFGRSVHTVSVHTLSLYRKRGVHTQVELLLAYLHRREFAILPEKTLEPTPHRQPLSVVP